MKGKEMKLLTSSSSFSIGPVAQGSHHMHVMHATWTTRLSFCSPLSGQLLFAIPMPEIPVRATAETKQSKPCILMMGVGLGVVSNG